MPSVETTVAHGVTIDLSRLDVRAVTVVRATRKNVTIRIHPRRRDTRMLLTQDGGQLQLREK